MKSPKNMWVVSGSDSRRYQGLGPQIPHPNSFIISSQSFSMNFGTQYNYIKYQNWDHTFKINTVYKFRGNQHRTVNKHAKVFYWHELCRGMHSPSDIFVIFITAISRNKQCSLTDPTFLTYR